MDCVGIEREDEPQKSSKRRKTGGTTEKDGEIKAMVATILENNKRLSQKIERLEHNTQTQIMTQAVSTSGPPSHGKPKSYPTRENQESPRIPQVLMAHLI